MKRNWNGKEVTSSFRAKKPKVKRSFKEQRQFPFSYGFNNLSNLFNFLFKVRLSQDQGSPGKWLYFRHFPKILRIRHSFSKTPAISKKKKSKNPPRTQINFPKFPKISQNPPKNFQNFRKQTNKYSQNLFPFSDLDVCVPSNKYKYMYMYTCHVKL